MTTLTSVLARLIGRAGPSAHTAEVALHAELAKNVIDDVSRQLGTSCAIIDVRATRTGSLTIRFQADRAYVAKLPLQPVTEPRLRENARRLKALHQASWMTPYLSARCPVVVHAGTASGYFYSVETAVPGRDGASILKDGGNRNDLILSAERFLYKLQKASLESERIDRSRWQRTLDAAIRRVQTLAEAAARKDLFSRLVADLRAKLGSHHIPSVYSHGNFWVGNALFDCSNNLTGVIDWDCADDFALPATDLIYLLIRAHSAARSTSVGEALADWIDAESLPIFDDCLSRHCQALSIPTKLIEPLSYCSWILHLDAHCRFGTKTATSARWLDRNVRLVLDRWRLWATAGRRNVPRWQRVG
jgi:aminoglycoside phosphotransferase (APT) family kinase protein